MNAYALLGKAQVFNKDWAGAKESLKKVIDSNFYALTPGEQIADLFHVAGDGNEEKVLEMNYVYNDSFGKYGAGKFHYQRNQALFLRMLKAYPDILIKEEGWGNNCAPTKPFVDAMMNHEPNSARRKAWMATYEELITRFLRRNPDRLQLHRLQGQEHRRQQRRHDEDPRGEADGPEPRSRLQQV